MNLISYRPTGIRTESLTKTGLIFISPLSLGRERELVKALCAGDVTLNCAHINRIPQLNRTVNVCSGELILV